MLNSLLKEKKKSIFEMLNKAFEKKQLMRVIETYNYECLNKPIIMRKMNTDEINLIYFLCILELLQIKGLL